MHVLLGIEDYNALAGHPVVGADWEGFVIENLLSVAPDRTQASFYRTSAGAERYPVSEDVQALGALEMRRRCWKWVKRAWRTYRATRDPDVAWMERSGIRGSGVSSGAAIPGFRPAACIRNEVAKPGGNRALRSG